MDYKEQANQKSILLVDDDQMIRDMYRDVLKKEGYAVTTAVNGKAALEYIAQKLPDLILLDLMMPDMNGVEVIRELKKDDKYKDIPIIVFTNYSERQDMMNDPDKLGVAGVIMKSEATPNQIVEKVSACLKKSQL